MRKVLLLGGTGAVGQACLDVLTRYGDAAVLITGRHEERLRRAACAAGADVAIARLDVGDTAAVRALVKTCDVVVNCAGPTRQLSAQTALVAVAAGVPYVDPGGDQTLVERLTTAVSATAVVLQTGVQPGLSGLLLRALALHRPGHLDDVTAWCGGLQPITAVSALEYLASLRDTKSHPGAVLRDGSIRPVRNIDCPPPPAQYFPRSITTRPHLDAETIAVAAQLGIRDLRWLNVFDGPHTIRAMQSLLGDWQRSDRVDPHDAVAAARLDLFGRRPYFAIVVTGHDGDPGGPTTTTATTVAFSCADSYRVTGALTAFATREVTKMAPGVHPLSSIDDPQRAWEFVTDVVPGATISITESITHDTIATADDAQSALDAAIEEGVL